MKRSSQQIIHLHVSDSLFGKFIPSRRRKGVELGGHPKEGLYMQATPSRKLARVPGMWVCPVCAGGLMMETFSHDFNLAKCRINCCTTTVAGQRR